LSDPAGKLPGPGEGLARGYEPADEARFGQPGGREVLAGQDDLHSQVVRDPAGQPEQSARASDQPAPDLMIILSGAMPATWLAARAEIGSIAGRSACCVTRICRIEGVAPGRIYAQECILFHDSASVLTSQRQLLRNLFT
jgi:hypothetical protein